MPIHENDPPITKEMLCLKNSDLEAMRPVEYRNLIVPLMNIISTETISKRSGPFGILGEWQKKYTRKRIYEVLVVLYNSHLRTKNLAAYVTKMLKESYTESNEYEVIDDSDEARYGS